MAKTKSGGSPAAGESGVRRARSLKDLPTGTGAGFERPAFAPFADGNDYVEQGSGIVRDVGGYVSPAQVVRDAMNATPGAPAVRAQGAPFGGLKDGK
jgi:hypothetical protein